MLNLYLVFALVTAILAYTAIQQIENDGVHLMPFQYIAVAICGLFWPVVLVLLILDFWPKKEDDGEEENIE